MTNCLRIAFLRLSSDTNTYSAEINIGLITQGGTKRQNEVLCEAEAFYQPSNKRNQISREFIEKRLGYMIDGTSAPKDITVVWCYHVESKYKYKSKFRVSFEGNLDVVFGSNDTFVYDGSNIISVGDVKVNPFGDALKHGHLRKRRSSWRRILLKPGSIMSKPQQSSVKLDSVSQQGLKDNVVLSLQDRSVSQHPVQMETGFSDLDNHTSHLLQEIPRALHFAKVSIEDCQPNINNVDMFNTTAAVDPQHGLRLFVAPQCEPSSVTQGLMAEEAQGHLDGIFSPSTELPPANFQTGKSPSSFTRGSRSLADSSLSAPAEIRNQSFIQSFSKIPDSRVLLEPISGLNNDGEYQLSEPGDEASHVNVFPAASIPLLRFLQERTDPATNDFPMESSWQVVALDVDDARLTKSLDSGQHLQTAGSADEISQDGRPSGDPQGILDTLREKSLECPDQYWHWDERVQKYYHFDADSELPIWYELLD